MYQIEYELTNQDQCEDIANPTRLYWDNITTTDTILDMLIPYSKYSIFIVGFNEAGPGMEISIEGTTNETGSLHLLISSRLSMSIVQTKNKRFRKAIGSTIFNT